MASTIELRIVNHVDCSPKWKRRIKSPTRASRIDTLSIDVVPELCEEDRWNLEPMLCTALTDLADFMLCIFCLASSCVLGFVVIRVNSYCKIKTAKKRNLIE